MHYEIVFLVHPDQEEQLSAMLERYRAMIEQDGSIHRLEQWGRRTLAYPINKVYKACYVLMNVECGAEILQELTRAFRLNDAVLRHLVIRRRHAITEPSPLLRERDRKSREAEAGESAEAEQAALVGQGAAATAPSPEATPEATAPGDAGGESETATPGEAKAETDSTPDAATDTPEEQP